MGSPSEMRVNYSLKLRITPFFVIMGPFPTKYINFDDTFMEYIRVSMHGYTEILDTKDMPRLTCRLVALENIIHDINITDN
jgi:hypothetical protein